MKKIWLSARILVTVAFLATIPLNSCVKVDDTNNNKSEKKERIKSKDNVVLHGSRYVILDVDGHQYLCNSDGGMIHLESCSCKQ